LTKLLSASVGPRNYDAAVASAERELKLGIGPAFVMPELDNLADGVRPLAWDPALLSTVYFDTEDFRLARWGASLRHRLGEGWTVKLPPDSDGDVLVREEIAFGGSAKRPPAGAADLVRAFTRGVGLMPQTRLRTTRQRIELRDASGRLVADVFEDHVSVNGGNGASATFGEVEVEIGENTSNALFAALRERLAAAGAQTADPTPKYLRSLADADLSPVVALAALRENASLGDVVRLAVASSATRLVTHDPIVRLDSDPEGVHQARVATRRLRSDLRTFRTLVDAERASALADELRWLGRLLGDVRDDDVLLERLRARSVGIPGHARGMSEVLSRLARERDARQAALLDGLRGRRYLQALDDLVTWANEPPLLTAAEAPASEAAPALAARPWRTLQRVVSKLPKKPNNAELHDVRIRTKRARYAAEAVIPVVGTDAKAFARAAAALQDVLGDLNDAVVARRRLLQWAETGSRDESAAATALAKLERQVARRRRNEWRDAWDTLSAPELSAWM
jgi:CHAD domain-containing protein